MKQIFLAICGLLILGIDASPHSASDFALTLNPECAKGQVYWCQDLATAKSCRATRHCIKAVWEKQEYPVDNDSICQICLDMVKQARDQLRSNETQEEMKEVFEGTCELIRIKAIRKQCDKLADDLVPELIEALSSQMNPQVVCSVSGLCNSATIDRELAAHANEVIIAPAPPQQKKASDGGLTCQQCNKISDLISTKFANTDRDQVLEGMLSACGEMSSLSDGCSAIVLAYFNEVYDHMKTNLNAENICHMAGRCADQFHVHEEDEDKIEVIEDSHIGFVQHGGVDDDIPCDLCKQLIVHLRDLLVANTTEAEFKNILEGICKQTKSFKQECLSLADQYYDLIYAKLTKELDPEGACFMIGICPKDLTNGRHQHSFEIAPLVPTSQLLVKKKILGDDEPVLTAQQIQNFQLPKDVLLLSTEQLQANVDQQKKGTQFCTLCEYFLHFAQEALASPVNEENIKESVLKMCTKVKKEFQSECQQFVNMYGDAVIALLIQEIDPSQVCPKLSLCKSITPMSNANEKCPLCLFLVQDLEEKIKGDKSKKNIEDKLHRLCDHLRDDLKAECIDFINTYTGELVDKLASDFTPREICLYLKCCTDKEEMRIEKIGDKAAYNDYLTNTIYQIEPEQTSAPECLLCEQLVKQVEKKITKDKSREHIKKVLEQACSELPKAKLKNKCLSAIEKNTDFIIDLLIKEVTPKEVCLALGFCFASINDDIVEVIPLVDVPTTPPSPEEYVCRFCKIVVQEIEDKLNDKSNQEDVENCVKQICDALPKKYQPKCRKFIDAYADEIIKYLPNEPPKEICRKACACPASDEDDIDYLEDDSISDDFDSGFDVTQGESPECVLCEEVIHEVEKRVKDDKSREHVKEVLEQACSSMPRKDLKQKCDQLVEQYADYIVDSIVKGLEPQQVCHGIGLCATHSPDDDSKIIVSDHLMERYSETPQCVLCELIATKLEAQLKNNKTQDEIENAVRKICRSLPAKFNVKCKKFIEDYADLIIGLVATVPPKELCGELNFCRDNLRKDTSQRDIMECGVCYSAVDALATVLEKHGPKDKEIVVETTCHLLPAKYYDQCHELMNIYGISLTNLIKRDEKRSEICVKIGKCYQDGDNSMFVEIHGTQQSHRATSTKPERLFGANKCTYGPGYWCLDRQHMEECNAVEFCTKKYNKSP